ncbi:MAG: DUF4443 domain-containing protein [Thermoprotei archaeon]|nr:DUF4443 domain-containing protein [TACK group archaeon]
MEDPPSGVTISSALETLSRIGERRAGPPQGFSIGHVILALMYLQQADTSSRSWLSKELGLGEGSVKTLLKRLECAGLISKTRRGNSLTDKGKSIVQSLQAKIGTPKDIELDYLSMGEHNVAVKLAGLPIGALNPIRLRDDAIGKGASGLTTLLVRGKQLVIPPEDFPLSMASPSDNEILSKLELSEGDVILVCGASTAAQAKRAAMEVVVSTLSAHSAY